jgi:uncharacterized protein with ATP-grasp and redox domains
MNNQDEKLQEKILRKVIDVLANADWTSTPIQLTTKIHKIVREETGIQDPYKEVKEKYNEIILNLYTRIKEIINKSPDPLNTAIRMAIAGNIIDFGPKREHDINIEKTIEDVLNKDFTIDDYQLLKERIKGANNLLFFADNSGEIVFDKILIETIIEVRKNMGIKRDLKITVIVKGGPILNDATLDDVKFIGMDKIPNIEFKTTNNGNPNTGPSLDSGEVKTWIKEHDVTIAKGMGNYESLSEFNDLFFLLITKCNVVASDLGVKKDDIILKYNKRK